MGYDYEEELARAREIRRRQKLEKTQGHQTAGDETVRRGSQTPRDGRAGETGARGSRAREAGAGETGARSSRAGASGTRDSWAGASGTRDSRIRANGAGQSGIRDDGVRRSQMPGRAGKNPEKTRKRKRIITMIIAEVFALLFIFLYAYVYKLYTAPQRPKFEAEDIKSDALSLDDIKKMKGYWMIAIFGVDSRGTNVGAGTNADVNMICCINQDTGDIKLVSVFRDSYLNIDDKNAYNKINYAYAVGGPQQAVKALNKNLDLNITDYITFNWKGVADAINILGGVDLEISKAEFRYINSFITETVKTTGIGSYQLKSAGMNHLDGVQAVAYGRLRLMDNDYARTERQRKIIQLAFEKAKKAEYSVLNNILVVVLPQVATSLDFADLTNVALNITKYQLGDTSGFPDQRGEANMGKKGACVVPATLESNVKRLHNFLFGDEDYTPSETVRNISAKIASDTGIYKEGQVMGHVSTEGVLPKETSAPVTTEAMTEEATRESESETETDEYGNPVISSTEEPTRVYPSIGETDEFGNLIDGPDEEDPLDRPGLPSSPGDTEYPGATSPGDTTPSRPGSTMPSDDVTGPGIRPGETTSAAPGPGGPGGGTPGENTGPVRPGDDIPETTATVYPGGTTGQSNGPGDVIGNTGPGE